MRKILFALVFCLLLTSGYAVKVIATISIGSVSDIAQGTLDNITCTTTISGTGTAQLYNVSLQYANGTVGGWINLNATNTAVNISFNDSGGSNPQYLRTVVVESTNFTIKGVLVSSGNNFRCMAQNTSATAVYSSVSSMSVTGGAPPANVTIITFNYPADASTNTTTQNIQFGYTPTFYGGKATNCSLYTNRTGTWLWTTANATAITNNSLNTITYDFGVDTNVRWSIGCYNNQNLNFTNGNRTLTINTYVPPIQIAYSSVSDPIDISVDNQIAPSSLVVIYALLRNSSGVGQTTQPVNSTIYDSNRNIVHNNAMNELGNGIYYCNEYTLPANANGTYLVRINTTSGVSAIKTFFVRSFASGTGGGLDANQNQTLYNTMGYAQQTNTTLNKSTSSSGGLDANQNSTLYQAMWYGQQTNLTINKSTDQSIPFVQQINTTLNKTVVPDLDSIISTLSSMVANIWGYGTRTLSDYSGVWSVGTRTLSSYGTLISDFWNYATRGLTTFDFKVVTSGGNITNVTSPIYCANCSTNGTTANDVWTYTLRNLTQAVGSSNLTSCGQGNSNLTSTDVWDATTRTLTQAVGSSNLTYCGAGNSNLSSSDVWGYGDRQLTVIACGQGNSNLTANDIWNAGVRTLTTSSNCSSTGGYYQYICRQSNNYQLCTGVK